MGSRPKRCPRANHSAEALCERRETGAGAGCSEGQLRMLRATAPCVACHVYCPPLLTCHRSCFAFVCSPLRLALLPAAGCEQADLAVTCRARVGQGRMSDTEFVTLVIRAHLVDIEHLSVPVVRALHFLLVACRSLEPPLLLPQVSRLDAPEWWSFRCRRKALSL